VWEIDGKQRLEPSKAGEDSYDYHRPHGGLGGQTPYERLLQKRKCDLPRLDLKRFKFGIVVA
jgi:hypothetical protein